MKTPSAKLPILAVLLLVSSGLAATEQPCANQDPHGPTSLPCKCPPCCTLAVFGSVGKMPLQFHRNGNTRVAPLASSQNVKITGTPFGSDPYFNNDPAFGAAKAFDGDTSTYYRYAFLRNAAYKDSDRGGLTKVTYAHNKLVTSDYDDYGRGC